VYVCALLFPIHLRYSLYSAHPELAHAGYAAATDLSVAKNIADGYVLPLSVRACVTCAIIIMRPISSLVMVAFVVQIYVRPARACRARE
jgi:hypothetical protein